MSRRPLTREAGAANWFIALEMPPLPAWEDLTRGLPEGMRRFSPQDRHLTLAFLGPCGAVPAERAWVALAGLRHAPIDATAGAWRAMGPRSRPSAYALTLARGRDPAAALIGDWGGRALIAAGLPPSRRRPLPHITLARPPRRRAASLREPMRQWLRQAPLPAAGFRLDTLALYTWSDERTEHLFRIVAERPVDSPESLVSPSPTAP